MHDSLPEFTVRHNYVGHVLEVNNSRRTVEFQALEFNGACIRHRQNVERFEHVVNARNGFRRSLLHYGNPGPFSKADAPESQIAGNVNSLLYEVVLSWQQLYLCAVARLPRGCKVQRILERVVFALGARAAVLYADGRTIPV